MIWSICYEHKIIPPEMKMSSFFFWFTCTCSWKKYRNEDKIKEITKLSPRDSFN